MAGGHSFGQYRPIGMGRQYFNMYFQMKKHSELFITKSNSEVNYLKFSRFSPCQVKYLLVFSGMGRS